MRITVVVLSVCKLVKQKEFLAKELKYRLRKFIKKECRVKKKGTRKLGNWNEAFKNKKCVVKRVKRKLNFSDAKDSFFVVDNGWSS